MAGTFRKSGWDLFHVTPKFVMSGLQRAVGGGMRVESLIHKGRVHRPSGKGKRWSGQRARGGGRDINQT